MTPALRVNVVPVGEATALLWAVEVLASGAVGVAARAVLALGPAAEGTADVPDRTSTGG